MRRSGRDLFRVRRSCRPVRPRPHSALVTFPPLPHRSVGIRKDTKSNYLGPQLVCERPTCST